MLLGIYKTLFFYVVLLYTHIHTLKTHTHTHTLIYKERERERKREREGANLATLHKTVCSSIKYNQKFSQLNENN